MDINEGVNMKKIIILLLIIAISLLACSCTPIYYKEPIAYADSKWECKNAEMSFHVGNPSEYVLIINGEKIQFSFLFSAFDPHVVVYQGNERKDDNYLFSGKWKCNKRKFIIKVLCENDYFAEGTKLIFDRVE